MDLEHGPDHIELSLQPGVGEEPALGPNMELPPLPRSKNAIKLSSHALKRVTERVPENKWSRSPSKLRGRIMEMWPGITQEPPRWTRSVPDHPEYTYYVPLNPKGSVCAVLTPVGQNWIVKTILTH
jgi:hypothetical protein